MENPKYDHLTLREKKQKEAPRKGEENVEKCKQRERKREGNIVMKKK